MPLFTSCFGILRLAATTSHYRSPQSLLTSHCSITIFFLACAITRTLLLYFYHFSSDRMTCSISFKIGLLSCTNDEGERTITSLTEPSLQLTLKFRFLNKQTNNNVWHIQLCLILCTKCGVVFFGNGRTISEFRGNILGSRFLVSLPESER